MRFRRVLNATALVMGILIGSPIAAQDRLKTMPGYENYQKMQGQAAGTVKRGTLIVSWKDEGKAFEYSKDGKRYRFDIATQKAEEVKPGTKSEKVTEAAPVKGRRRNNDAAAPQIGVARGRQATEMIAPGGKVKAVYKNRNLYIADADGGNETPVTTDGSEKDRIKYGTASWVYGEELYQNTAMWWSPDGSKLAYYRFDESKVKDYYLQMNQTKVQGTMDTEPYPKAGTDNPVVDLFIYDVATKQSTKVDVRSGQPFEDSAIGYYVYNIAWSPNGGKELLFNRTNRRQNIMEFCAASETGSCRVIVREEWLPSWTENLPKKRYLSDNNRFIWTSSRTGFKNFYLYDLSGKLHATLTNLQHDVDNIVRVDEKQGLLYYMAHDGDNPYKLQLHRVGLDGKGDIRLTDPAFNHSVDIAPDGKHFIDTIQTHNQPESARLVNDEGKVLAELTKYDMSAFIAKGFKTVELIKYKAADGETDLYGLLHFPSNFDPNKKYPLLVSVYAGPETNGAGERFITPHPYTEYGFLVATLDSRSAANRGKKILDSIYLKLGVTEIDDQAAGVKSLYSRPYLDKERVGIHGTSYGGYASILCILRHPDVFHAACASSPVTDYRHYDTIYTERYLYTPQENKKGYDEGSAMTYVNNLKGRLMIYYGTADDNVHPNNSMQLIRALQRAGKSFDVQVGPDLGHTAVNQQRMMEFFIENLVMKK